MGAIAYTYPGASSSLNYNYNEILGSIGYDFGAGNVTFAVNYSGDYFAASGNAAYYALDFNFPLPKDFSLLVHADKQNIDDNAAFGAPDCSDYKLRVSRSIAGFTLALDYIATDLSKSQCFAGSSACDNRLVFSVSRSM